MTFSENAVAEAAPVGDTRSVCLSLAAAIEQAATDEKKVPPAGWAVGGATGCPLQSTAPQKVAAAPLKIAAKKGSVSTSCRHVATKSGGR